MKKRIFALALALCMMLSVMPTSFAGNGFLTLDNGEQAPSAPSGILTDDSKAAPQSGVLTGASKYYRDGILYNTGSQSGASYSLPSGTLTLDENVNSTNTLTGSGDTTSTRSSGLKTIEGNGLELRKKVEKVSDNDYKITLEAYTTGTVTTSTSTIPVDIVLVLDQSASMSLDFAGNSTEYDTARRQYALKLAVNSFIDSVSQKYSAKADHRMAIVTFGSSASTLQGWTDVSETGKTALQSKVSGLPTTTVDTETQVDDGIAQADTLIGSGYTYTGTHTQRQKVVIVFTDGVPTASGDFDPSIATNAISSSKQLKNAGVAVYTVGIFTGADPNQLYGDKFDRWLVPDDLCNGTVGEFWGYTNLNAWVVGGEESIRGLDIAATNRFLNYLSSNFNTATEIGIEAYSEGLVGGVAWRITKNFQRAESSYYLMAKDSTSLNKIFQTISENIQTANIDLDGDTVVKDVISPYFDLPTATSKIKLYTAAAKADGSFEDNVSASDEVKATISSDYKTVSVTGFDFNKNFVSDTAKTDGTYGKKLIIEFAISPKAGFLGGNDVPTNDDANAGIYLNNGDLVENFPNGGASTNVPVADVTVDVTDKNIYLSQTLDDSGLLADTTVKVGSVELNMTDTTTYGLEAWQYAYVTISTNVATNTGAKWTDDEVPFTLTCTVETKDKTVDKSDDDTANVNVFKPVVTFQDSTIYLGTTPAYEAVDEITGAQIGNYQSVVWKHGTTDADPTKMGNAPVLAYNYNPLQSNVPTDCVDVNVNVAIDQNDVTDYVTFTDTREDEYEFTVHVVKPVITSEDITIYLSNTVDLNGQMTVGGEWKCDHTSLTATGAPQVSYSFKVDSRPVSTATDYQPLGCTEINVTATVNGKDAPISKDAISNKDYSTFRIHVLKPAFTVTCTDLWADYGRKVTLDQGMNIGNNITWGHSCENTSYGTPTDWSISCNYAYTPNDKITDNQYTMGEADKNFNVEVVSFTIKDEKNNETTYPQSDKTLSDFATITYKKGEVVTNEFTVHVNKFDLTISKTWNGAACYAQDAIFLIKHVVDDEETEITKAMIAAPVKETRSGQIVWKDSGDDKNGNTITITGLLCGQEYKIEEETAWTWRWNSSPKENTISKAETKHDKVLTADPHTLTEPAPHPAPSVSFVNNLIDGLGELWFSFCTFVQNIFGLESIQKGGN